MSAIYGIDLGTTYTKCALVHPTSRDVIVFALDRSGPRDAQPTQKTLRSAVTVGVEGGNRVAWVGNRSAEIMVERRDDDLNLRRFEEAKMSIGEDSEGLARRSWHYAPHGWDYRPEDIGALVLRKVMQEVERAHGPPMERVVITHPQYFNDARRHATRQAAELAGLEVVDMMTEPDAAAYAFTAHARPGNYMVFDMGGGTLDVTVCHIEPGSLRVLSSEGSKRAGRDFDRLIFEEMVRQYQLVAPEFTESSLNRSTRQDWLSKAESIKLALNTNPIVRLESYRCEHKDFEGPRKENLDFTRDWFERKSAHILSLARDCVQDSLRKAGLNWSSLEGVLCVGGSTRLWLIRDMLSTLSGKTISLGHLDVDTAIAAGAAVRADEIARGESKSRSVITEAPAVRFSGILARGLGVRAFDKKKNRHVVRNLVEGGVPVPLSKLVPKTFKSTGKGRTTLSVQLYEGDSETPEECVLLGTVTLNGIAPSEEPRDVEVVLDVEANGRKHLTVRSGGKEIKGVMEFDGRRVLPPAELQQRREFISSLRIL